MTPITNQLGQQVMTIDSFAGK